MMKKTLYTILGCILLPLSLCAQSTVYGGKVELDRTVQDFGDVLLKDGPLSCSFTVKNISSESINILSVVSSCGCTDVKWTRESIAPGQSGTISATYSNDEGAFAFDKALTAYVSGVSKPIVLRLRGVSHEKAQPLEELYPIHYGPLALKESEIKGPNVEMGQPRSGSFKVANLGSKPITLGWAEVSEGLKLSGEDMTIKSREVREISYTITPILGRWGRQSYYATPLVGGKVQKSEGVSEEARQARGAEAVVSEPDASLAAGTSRIGITSWTKDSFSDLTREQKLSAPALSVKESSASFGRIKTGEIAKVTFNLTNTGRGDARIYAMDADTQRLKASGDTLIHEGKTGQISASFDTTGLPKGEVLVILSLTTSCPSRPIINLYVTGFIK